jgi:large subunit ribosomal protein L1
VRRSKRYKQGATALSERGSYPLSEAIEVLQSFPRAKFDETVEMAFHLGVDPKKSEQKVRGTVTLPNGTGKVPRIVVVARGEDKLKAALEAGAVEAGHEELIKRISEGWLDFDVLIASPEVMRDLGRLGKMLGPKGLMPSPKTGTVAEDVAAAVEEVKKGRIEFNMDRHGNVHVPVGRISFAREQIVENAEAVVSALLRARPAAAKGQYVTSATVSSTMGPGIRLDVKEVLFSTK